MKPQYAALFLLFLPFATGAQQFQNILIDGSGYANEPAIAIDPTNPQRMVASANLDYLYTTDDGGLTWTTATPPCTYGTWGDPAILADTNGSFYYFHLSNVYGGSRPGTPGWVDRMVCQRMDGFTHTWTTGTYTGLDSPKVQDKPGIAYDRQRGRIYIAWTQFDKYGSAAPSDSSFIYFSYSTDRGDTWSKAVRISTQGGDCTDEDGTVEGAVPCVGLNGEVYVSWASASGIKFKRSPDGGLTWPNTETFVAPIPGGWDYNVPGLNRCNGMPYTASDVSNGVHRGTIYINWTAPPSGARLPPDVWLSRSTDGGATWSNPLQINKDTGIPYHDQFLSSMTVDPVTGYVYILYYDRRNEMMNNETEVYMAVSSDGGQTFKEIKVSTSKFIPTANVFFGDYTGIAAYNNVVRPIWGRMDGRRMSILTAIINNPLNVGGPGNALADQTRLDAVYPNPFSAVAEVPFTLAQAGPVQLYITDIYGRKVATVIAGERLEAGVHSRTFHTEGTGLVQGVYFFVLEAGGVRKVVRALAQ